MKKELEDKLLARIEIDKKTFIFTGDMYNEHRRLTPQAMREFRNYYNIELPEHDSFGEVIRFLFALSQRRSNSVVMFFCDGFGQ
jgi:hypothetical protein